MKRFASIAVLIAGFAAFAMPAFAFKLQQQQPCAGICKQLTFETQFPLTVRSFTFNAPSKGRALVHFHGSIVCSGAAGYGFNLNSQITDASNANPNSVGPGGLKLFGRADDSAGEMPFNLASNRVFAVEEGNNTFFFRIGGGGLPLNPGTQCFIYNASFTVLLLP